MSDPRLLLRPPPRHSPRALIGRTLFEKYAADGNRIGIVGQTDASAKCSTPEEMQRYFDSL